MPEIDMKASIRRLCNNAGSEAYELFVKALETEVAHVTATVIEAGPDDVRVKQGQAQMAQKFLRYFKEATK